MPGFVVNAVYRLMKGSGVFLSLFVVWAGMVAAPAATVAEPTFGDIVKAVIEVNAKIKPGARTAGSLGLQRAGSGVLIGDDGLILTIGYLIMESDSLSIVTRDGVNIPADFVAYDHRTGFGLLRATRTFGVTPLALGDSEAQKAGMPLLVVSTGDQGAVTPVRVVSRRSFAGYWEYLLDTAIYTMPMHRQYGGAALLDLKGQLVGIGSLFVNDAMAPDEETPGNMFVPVNLLKPILADLLTSGTSGQPARPWIGVYTGEAKGKVIVNRVAADGPGALAGVKPGDIIIGVAGRRVSGMVDLYRKVWSRGAAGIDVPLDVLPLGSTTLEIKKITVHSRDRHKWLRLGNN